MKKDVIYIDVDDDITSIIGKVKDSKESVVALVPPKRVGVLQSAVNLRLLARAAKQSDKKLALVTNDHSFRALAAAANIPAAKNLQSEPELAEIAALEVDDDEVIDGASLPVGEHVTQSKSPADEKEIRNSAMAASLASTPKPVASVKQAKQKNTSKVPNFDTFRKKLIFIILGLLLLVGFLVWAIFFAAKATVVLSAKTTNSSVNESISIKPDVKTSFENAQIKAITQQESEDKSVTFSATGKKDVGKKASGTVDFSKGSPGDATVEAGTKLETDGGLVFILDETVNVPGATLSFSCQPNNLCPGEASGSVSAAENGSKYNAATGGLSGAPSGVSARFDGPTSGGVTKSVNVVTASDVQAAKQKLADENTDAVKSDLESKFASGTVAIPESFAIEYKDVSSSPKVGAEADDATLKATVQYVMYGAAQSEVKSYLEQYFKQELDGQSDQRVYKDGSDKVSFQDAESTNGGAKATVIATGQIGPQIDNEAVKEQAKGKKFGEIQQELEAIKGIDSVDVKFFPFWVNTVPEDSDRISVEFKLDDSK